MTRCSRCPGCRPPVPGCGPVPCEFLFLGEQPAFEEDRRGRPFVGRSGRELDGSYLYMAGLTRPDIYVTNARKCSTWDYSNPEPEDARVCAETHFHDELESVRPRVIVAMGAIACSLFPNIDLEKRHGFPIEARFGSWSGIVFPTYHPAAGLHETSFMIPIQADFEALRKYRYGDLSAPVDQYPDQDYRLIESPIHLDRCLLDWSLREGHTLAPNLPWPHLATDTEYDSRTGEPHCLSFSVAPGTGGVIMADDPATLEAYKYKLLLYEGIRIIFHTYLADEPVYRQLDLPIPQFFDSVVEAYHNSIQQKLKVLAYRLCGLHMVDYDDLVRPYAVDAALDYLRETMGKFNLPKPVQRDEKSWLLRLPDGSYLQSDKGKLRTFKYQRTALENAERLAPDLYKALRRLTSDVTSRGSDPVKRWKDHLDDWGPEAGRLVGRPFPLPSIKLVPRDQLVPYSAQDADATLRVKKALLSQPRRLPLTI